jgi:outer membrane protein assembly factor BamB
MSHPIPWLFGSGPARLVPTSGAFACALLLTMGCGEGAAPASAPDLTVRVAPLDLPGIAGACYRLEVFGAGASGPFDEGTRVWARDVCSDDYGTQDGAISYVGPCDAGGGARPNTVALALLGVDGDDGPLVEGDDYVNPCPAPDGCRETVTCRPNADIPVDFDLTLMRSAEQGFFDLAVEFEDIFCSAKVDCARDLLFNGDTRDDTVVMAFACTAGPGADTHLYLSDVHLVCGATQTSILSLDPSLGEGNLPLPAPSPDGVFGYAVHRGVEALPGMRKAYWNVAVGIAAAFFEEHEDCGLLAWGTAHDGTLDEPFTTPAGLYPYVRFAVPLDPAEVGALSCTERPLDSELVGGVTTEMAGRPGDPAVCFQNELAVDWEEQTATTRRVPSDCPLIPPTDPCAANPNAPGCTEAECTSQSCEGGTCEDPVFTCATITQGTLAFEALPALGAGGLVHTAGRTVPVNDSAPQNDLHRVGRTYVLRSSDLGIEWGPVPNHANCAFNSGSPTPALDERGWVFTQGDWNDGSSDFCASIFAKRQDNGAALWSTQPGGPHPRHPIALGTAHAIYGGNRGSVRAFDLVNGNITATMNLAVGYSEGGSIILTSDGDTIISQWSHKMERWTLAGTRVWTSTALRHLLDPTLGDNVVGFGASGANVTYVNGASGAQVWSFAITGGAGAILTDEVGHLYFGHANAATSLTAAGALRWSRPLNGAATAQFLGNDGRFYVRTNSTLYALSMADGAIVWRLDAVAGNISISGQNVANRFSGYFSLLAGGDIFGTDYAGRMYRLATPDLDYAPSTWPRPRGNRLNSGRAGHVVDMP